MAEAPKLRWSVYVSSNIQPNGPLPNFGEGDTPTEALENLRRRWEDGRDEYAAALRALDEADDLSVGEPLN